MLDPVDFRKLLAGVDLRGTKEKYERNKEYFEKNFEEIEEEYEGEIVAVVDGEIAGSVEIGSSDEEVEKFFEGLEEEYGEGELKGMYSKCVDPDRTYIF